MPRNDGRDRAGRVRLDGHDTFARAEREEPRIEPRLERVDLSEILVVLGAVHAPAAADRRDLVHHVAERGIRPYVDVAAEADADLGRVAAADHVAILHEQRLRRRARGGLRGADAADSAADHNEVERAAFDDRAALPHTANLFKA